ncbi:MAG: GNAT family N-acetyltransferase [Actinomycetota bacterium]
MDIALRSISSDEIGPFLREVDRSFGEAMSDEEVERYAPAIDPDRCLVALDGDRWVATSGAYSLDLTLPGGTTVATAGVTAVGVRPTHRRRGILTSMMTQLHDQAREREEPVAALLASEAGIYGRFGYGVATEYRSVVIDRHRTSLPDAPAGSIELVTPEVAQPLFDDLFTRVRLGRVGQVTRPAGWAERNLVDRESDRDGAGPLEVSVSRDVDGVVDGMAMWRLKPNWNMNLPDGVVKVIELFAATDDARLRLHQHLMNVDLASSVELDRADLADPTRYALTDPRAYRTVAVGDWLWVSVLDPVAALAARSYETEDRLVLEIHDGPASTTVEIEAGAEAACRITTAAPDLVCQASTVGSLLLGGVLPSALATAGRLQGDPDAIARADRVFPTARPPFCQTMF